ncbi:MAG: lipid A phosphoethanolamine transferase [Prevotella sp.]
MTSRRFNLSALRLRLLSAQFLFIYTVVAITVPNLSLAFTNSIPLSANVISVVLPLSFYVWLMSLSRKTGRLVWLLFPLIFFAAFQMVLIYLYGGVVIAVDMFLNLATTNPDEAMELLVNLIPAVAGVLVLYIPLLVLAAWQWARHTSLEAAFQRCMRRAALRTGGVMLLAAALLYVVFPRGGERQGRFEYHVENEVYPINVFYNLALALHESWLSAHYQERVAHFRFGAMPTHNADSTEVYVLVVGETARSSNFQLYGYARPTNPQLSRESRLMVFRNVRSQSNTTHKSVPMLLTAATADDHSRLYHEKGILAAFGEAGFHTAFFSNQLRNHSYIDFLGEEANDACFIREKQPSSRPDDEQLLPYVAQELDQHHRKLFIVLHMYGSHFNYRDRYSRANARFLPDEPTEAKAENRPQLLNAYDNTILHTDRILARLIGMLRARHCISAMLYTSDHGENIFDDSRHLFLHASPRPSEYDTDVPLLVWTSEQFGRQYPQVINAMRSNLRKGAESNASVFPTMLSIAGIRARARADSLSLTNRTYRLGTRYYLDDHNHAVPLSTFLK